jgi:hypothetical protein
MVHRFARKIGHDGGLCYNPVMRLLLPIFIIVTGSLAEPITPATGSKTSNHLIT